MKLTAAAIRTALAHHVSAELAAALTLPDVVDDSQIGRILAAALGGGAGDAPLTLALFMPPDATVVTLDPAEALDHPAFRDWIAPTLAEALGAPFVAGVRLSQAAAGAPDFGTIHISDLGDGTSSGFAQLVFPLAGGVIEGTIGYGDQQADIPLITCRRISGRALALAGRDAQIATDKGQSSRLGRSAVHGITLH